MTSSTKLIQAASGVGGDTDFYPYTVDNSCRFNKADSAKLTKTFSTPTSDKKFVFSTWFKMSDISNINQIFSSGTSATNYAFIAVMDSYFWYIDYTGSNTLSLRTYGKKLFRDPSAWYHIVVAVDTTQSTSTDRVNVYFNGELYTDWEASQSNHGAQNYTPLLCAANAHSIGAGTQSYTSSYVEGYLSQSVFIDGQQLAASDFGEEKNGVWVPKEITGLTFGNNGFYLDFADSSNLGNDVSGNNNDLTSSGLAANDQMIDTPTNNFANLSIAAIRTGASSPVVSDGNLEVATPGSSGAITYWAFPSTGKYYFEIYYKTQVTWYRSMYHGINFADADDVEQTGATAAIINFEDPSQNNAYYLWGTWTSGPGVSQGEFGSVLVDMDANQVTLYRQGSALVTSSFPASDIGKPLRIHMAGGGDNVAVFNFGQNGTFNGSVTAQGNTDANGIGDFYYTVPTGALALCTANLPEPTIGPNSATLTSEVFEPILYTGNGTAIGSGGKTISSLAFQPDFTWIKNRDAADNHMLFDAVRGATKYLESDTADAEATDTESLASFTATGFTLGNNVAVNTNTEDYVAWNWKANGAGAANEDGSINTTKTSANTDAGVSILQYTGNATSGATVGHGLGAVPKFAIFKMLSQNAAAGYDFYVYHASLGQSTKLKLNTNGTASASTDWPTLATTSLFYLGGGGANNGSGLVYAAYLFAEVEGFSSFGSYTGNGNADGPFVYCGFSPAYVMVKSVSTTHSWWITDTVRNTSNPIGYYLYANLDGAGYSVVQMDALSNGFKLRTTGTTLNSSGNEFIYMAFAENPFKYSNAR